jgi:hypothetical protein
MEDDLPLDPIDGTTQSPQQYVEQLSSTTGLPWVLVRRNMEKIRGVMAEMGEVIAGSRAGSTSACSTPAWGRTRATP